MRIQHNIGENQKLYEKYDVNGSNHIPETEELCEVIRALESKELKIGYFSKEIIENTEDFKEAFFKNQTFHNYCMVLMTNRTIGVRDLLKIIYDLCMDKGVQ